MLSSWKKSYEKTRCLIIKQRHYFVSKCSYNQSYGFSSSQVWMWELNHKEGWALKNWCFWTVVLEKTLENPLDCKEIKLINSKGNQSWIFIGRTDAEAPMFGHLIQRPNLLEKTLTGKDWRQKEKGMAEDEMLGWYHRLNGYEFEQAQFSSVHSVVSDSFQPHGPQHTRPPCPSPTPGVHPNPRLLRRWWKTGKPGVLQSMGLQSWTRLSDWQ